MATPFWKRFTGLCEEKNITPNRVMLDTGLNNGNPSFWKNGRIPSNKILVALAEYFGVTVDYLLGGGEEKPIGEEKSEVDTNKAPDNGMSGDELLAFALYGMEYKSIPKEKLAEIRRYAEFIKDK